MSMTFIVRCRECHYTSDTSLGCTGEHAPASVRAAIKDLEARGWVLNDYGEFCITHASIGRDRQSRGELESHE